MLRPGSLTSPGGGSPVRVGTGALGSGPQLGGENRWAKRGVATLVGGSKGAGRSITGILQLRQIYNGGGGLLMSRRRPRPADPAPGVTSVGLLRVRGVARAHGLARNRRDPSRHRDGWLRAANLQRPVAAQPISRDLKCWSAERKSEEAIREG